MNITTSLFFQPSNGQPIESVDQVIDFREAAHVVMSMALSPTSPDGTYFIHHTIDIPTLQEVVIPFPTVTRLQILTNALADVNVILDPDDPRLFPLIIDRYRHRLQRMKNIVQQAIQYGHRDN